MSRRARWGSCAWSMLAYETTDASKTHTWSRSERSKDPPRGFGDDCRPTAPTIAIKSAPMLSPSRPPWTSCGMVIPLPLWFKKPWFAREFNPGHGDLESPDPAGFQASHLGSESGAAPPVSSLVRSRDCALTMVATNARLMKEVLMLAVKSEVDVKNKSRPGTSSSFTYCTHLTGQWGKRST